LGDKHAVKKNQLVWACWRNLDFGGFSGIDLLSMVAIDNWRKSAES
jgi:hypothetical protein